MKQEIKGLIIGLALCFIGVAIGLWSEPATNMQQLGVVLYGPSLLVVGLAVVALSASNARQYLRERRKKAN